MKKIVMFIVESLFLLTWYPGFCSANSCQLAYRAGNNDMGPAKLFGIPVTIPAFRLHFVDEKSSQSVTPTKISINYNWKWLEYPYPEHSLGAWSDVSDTIECLEPGAETLVPEFTVRPRGWYDGKYIKFPFTITGSKHPSFTGIGIVMHDVGCNKTRWVILSPKDVSRLKKNNSVIIKINCAGHSSIIIK